MSRIKHLHIENFKGLVDFDFPPAPNELTGFTCLIGMNGAGKSTLLQSLDFVAHVATGKIADWLDDRKWGASDLVSKLNGKRSRLISFQLKLAHPDYGEVVWDARFNTQLLRCTQESIACNGNPVLTLSDGRLHFHDDTVEDVKVIFEFEGSVLSALKLEPAHDALSWLKDSMAGLKSLELLAPNLIRRRARDADDIGSGGEKLSAYLSTLIPTQHEQLREELRKFYPWVGDWQVKSLRSGWKDLLIREENVQVGAAHVNDGFLRILAILAQSLGDRPILLFDEIEDGINPELIEKLVDFLIALDKQVIVTTHSPLVLNYIPDEVARDAVMLLYREDNGQSRCVRYFDVELPRAKLGLLGPGEVYADTRISDVVRSLHDNRSKGRSEL